ncbi:MAG: asparagine synthase (glutamine-hydrolyzing) [Rickettsia endosymbiont of Bryobia graminum]|nr:asparagine synthase (glutamine-hydrolyzing) [Rickettsia endosymbiont of Bryobia graminum]
MCGILGAFTSIGNIEALSNRLDNVINLLKHRGPDKQATWSNNSTCVLGHTRLAILDLSENGDQPMINNQDVIIYNGEIYNHHYIRQYYLPNTSFAGESDTETILKLIQNYGTEHLNKMNGMFAIAFYKHSDNSLLLVRDELHIKPIYYIIANDIIYFASEIKALVSLAQLSKMHINLDIFNTYLDYENWEPDASLIQEIQVLKAGSILKCTIHNNKLKIESEKFTFVNLRKEPKDKTTNPADYIIENINDSIAQHMLSDVNIASYLSGGIDSSLVTTLAARINTNILGFIGYYSTNPWYDERAIAKIVARNAGIKLIEVEITPDHFIQYFDELILALEEPRMGMGTFSQFIVAKEVSKHRKVILSGNGGDELFAGYPMMKAANFLDNICSIKAFINLKNFSFNEWIFLLYQLINKCTKTNFEFPPNIGSSKLLYDQKTKHTRSFFANNQSKYSNQLLDYYKKVYIPGLMAVEDRISMHFSIETRFPLWSQKLISSISVFSADNLLQGANLKGMLKQAINKHNLLPDEVLNAPKRGFPTPLRLWFKKELNSYIKDHLLNSNNELFNRLFNKSLVEKLLNSYGRMPIPQPVEEKQAHQIWMLLCIEAWLRQIPISSI